MEHRVSSLAQGQRLLAAIMITDAVGFSTRMSEDEALTLRLIDRDLTLIMETCGEFGGTVLKSTGDGLLIYFLSAVEAVSCGLEMQRRLVDLALGLDPGQYLDHRIGIHLGDILVSNQDVMGNGVNITARLQTYAKPRGLCVSQTIYDVVKARLNLHATYLGPLQLKNIQAPLPAYQLALQAEDVQEPYTSGEPSCTRPMATDALLGIAIRTLATDDQSRRIKKLVFAAYQQAWENDPAVLDQFDLRSLLVSLRERYPTLDDLDQQLQRVVMGLNRQTVYGKVATSLLKTLQPWYSQALGATPTALQNEITVLTVRSLEERCRIVAEGLRQHPEGLRLRKLLYCLGHNAWENNPTVLHQLDFLELVQQALRMAPRRQDLRYHLSRIVKHLNRRQDYTRLANDLIKRFQPLYLSQSGGGQLAPPVETSLEADPPEHTVVGLSPGRRDLEDVTTLHSSLSNIVSATPTGAATSEGYRPKRDRSSLFDLRVDILQYANPLRAKVLLHSCLHGPFGYTAQDWSSLSDYTLDDLLRGAFDYCPSYADLSSKLTIIAHCLGQAEENAQVASVIIQAMRSYYPQDPAAVLESAPGQASTTLPPADKATEAKPGQAPAATSCAVPSRRSAPSPA
ncbi:MAG: adenylate/guanylate cyclase domain-containing protein [Nodosilinea sp.]